MRLLDHDIGGGRGEGEAQDGWNQDPIGFKRKRGHCLAGILLRHASHSPYRMARAIQTICFSDIRVYLVLHLGMQIGHINL